jgi:hypothetical protein
MGPIHAGREPLSVINETDNENDTLNTILINRDELSTVPEELPESVAQSHNVERVVIDANIHLPVTATASTFTRTVGSGSGPICSTSTTGQTAGRTDPPPLNAFLECEICSGKGVREIHPLAECPELLEMNVEERIETLRKLKRCLNCFSKFHRVLYCRASSNCEVEQCRTMHHTILHNFSFDSASTPSTGRTVASGVSPRTGEKSKNSRPEPEPTATLRRYVSCPTTGSSSSGPPRSEARGLTRQDFSAPPPIVAGLAVQQTFEGLNNTTALPRGNYPPAGQFVRHT